MRGESDKTFGNDYNPGAGRTPPPVKLMSATGRSILGVPLPRSQQLLILVLALVLTGLWAWRAGLTGLPPAPSTPPQQQFYLEIRGDLPRPGVHVFPFPPTVQEVWEAAGGLGTLAADFRPLASGMKILVAPPGTVTLARMAAPELLTLGLAIDLNQASVADLEAIPGIGPVLAGRIVAFREKRGRFREIDELLEVVGFGPKILEKIKPYVVIIAVADENYSDSKETPPWNRKIPPFKTPKP